MDLFFECLHIGIILGNLLLWIPEKTRKFHLVFLFVTWFSWLILGLFYGIGYCFLTDWHWKIKFEAGETQLPDSYIKYLADKVFNIDSDPIWIDALTATVFITVTILSIRLNWKGMKEGRKSDSSAEDK